MAFIGVSIMRRLFPVVVLLVTLTMPVWAAEIRYELRVDGLACPYCAYGIEKKIKALDGVDKESIQIQLNEGVVVFEADTLISEGRLKRLINDAGFTLRGLKTSSATSGNAAHGR